MQADSFPQFAGLLTLRKRVYTGFIPLTDLSVWQEAEVISKCANPACSARFLYFHSGKLFRFEREAREDAGPFLGFDPSVRKRSQGVEFFWLCEACAAVMTLVYYPRIGVTIKWLRPELKAS